MAYERQKKEKWYHTRFIAYHSYLNITLKGKHLPIDKFMPLDENTPNSKATEESKAFLRERQKLAEQELKNKNING